MIEESAMNSQPEVHNRSVPQPPDGAPVAGGASSPACHTASHPVDMAPTPKGDVPEVTSETSPSAPEAATAPPESTTAAAGPVLELPPPAVVPKSSVPSIGVLGQVDTLSEFERIEYQACQAVLMMNSRSFVDVGQALASIRDQRLYREEFNTFEEYCRGRWEYSRRHADRLIFAAQVVTHLSPNWSHSMPAYESQLRPLFSLTAEQTNLAWGRAIELAHGRKVSARFVKAAVKELQFATPALPVSKIARQKKAEHRRLIDSTIGELLMLASQKASHDLITEKIEALHGYIQAVLPTPSKR